VERACFNLSSRDTKEERRCWGFKTRESNFDFSWTL